MKKEEREALEAAGWEFGDAADYLDLTPEERQLVELRLAVSSAFRKRRLKQRLTQAQTAKILGTSQPRIANIEAAAQDVTLDLMFRGLIALGGGIKDVRTSSKTGNRRTFKPGGETGKKDVRKGLIGSGGKLRSNPGKTGDPTRIVAQPPPPGSVTAKKRTRNKVR